MLSRSECTSDSCEYQVIWITGAFTITVTDSLTFVNVTMTGQHIIWTGCNADWCTHCMTSDYFFNLNGTSVTVIDHHPQLTGTEPYYTASQCAWNSYYDLFDVSSGANLAFVGCTLTDIRAGFYMFAYVEGSIAFIDTQILRIDFANSFVWGENWYGSSTVLFDHSYVAGWHRDKPLLNLIYEDYDFLYVDSNANLLIRHSVFEENYELIGTFLTYFEFMYFYGLNLEITDSVFRYCIGAFNLNSYQSDSKILIRNVTIDSNFNYFYSSIYIYWGNSVTLTDVHFLNSLGIASIVSISASSLVLDNVEFTNNRLLSLPYNTLLSVYYASTVVLSNCTFRNNGGYTDSYAPYFFYNHLLSLGLINPYPEIAQFFAEAATASCVDLIYVYQPSNVTVSNVTILGDLDNPCEIPININGLQGENWAVAASFISVLIAGGSGMGAIITAGQGNQVAILFRNCVFDNLKSALLLQNMVLIATNTTFNSIGAPLAYARYPPVSMSSGSIYLQNCSFLHGSGAISGAVYMYITDSFTTSVLSLRNCVFDSNAVVSGGATDVFFASVTPTMPATVEIRDCAFRNPISMYPSYSVRISSMNLDSAVIDNCMFTSAHVMGMGLLQLQPGSGTFSIIDTLFDSINSPGNDLVYLQTLTSPNYFIIENLNVRHCVFSTCIKIVGTSLNTTSCHFESNTGIVIYNSALYFQDNKSYFYNNTNTRSPCCYQSAYAHSAFYGTSFINNSAVQVGVIEIIGPSSSTVFEDCQFSNNSATVLTGVMQLTSSPEIRINNCTFLSNFARSVSVFMCEKALFEVFIANSIFGSNVGSGLLKAIYSIVRMINVTFTDLDFSQKDYQLMLVSNSKLTLDNSTVTSLHGLSGQGGCLLSMLMSSTAVIRSTAVSDVQCTQNVITVMLSSSLNLVESTFHNVSSSSGSIINSSTQGLVSLQWTHFRNISASLGVLYTQATDVSVVHSAFYEIKGTLVLHTESCSSVIIQSTNFDGVTAGRNVGIIQSIGCTEITIKDSNFTDINATVTAGVQVYDGTVSIENCLFLHMNAQTHGAIEIEGGSVVISQSYFVNNSAGNAPDSLGGAVYVNIPSNTSISIVNNTFTNNTAVAGGAVYWNSNQSMSELKGNNSYEGNTAQYGNDIAYSAFKLMYGNDSIPVLASGQAYTGSILIKIVDQLGQVVATDNSSKVLMVLRSGLSLEGSLVATAVQGVLSLSGFIVTGTPGTSASVTIVPNTNNCLNTSLTFPLRKCVIGEIEVPSGACVRCTIGTYSLDINGASCSNCFPDATCINGNEIYPNPGYWRPDNLYDGLFQCPNSDACENTPAVTSVTGICAIGYTGNMCQSCAPGYSNSGKDTCAGCPSKTNNIIRLSFVALAIFIFMAILVLSALRSATRKSDFTGAYMKILMNYLHITVLISHFDLNWTSLLQEMFNIHTFLGSSGEQFMSLDCAFTQAYFKKLVIITLIPIILLVVNIAIWAGLRATGRVEHSQYKLVCSLVVCLLYVHPIIVQNSLSAFHCVTIKPGEQWLRDEMNIPCWDHTHSTYTLGAALPAVVLWTFGIPTLFFLLLIKNRKRLPDILVKQAIGFLSIGYKPRTYFWEMIILYRKICVILLYVFTSSLPISLQALALCIMLWVAGSLHSKFKPFQTTELNKLEERSLWVCIIMIYSGIFFSTKTLSTEMQLTFSTVIILANSHFLALWLFFFFRKFLIKIAKNHPRIARFLPCLRVQESRPVPERIPILSPLMKKLYMAKLYTQVEQVTEG